jgi:hypothetical protein
MPAAFPGSAVLTCRRVFQREPGPRTGLAANILRVAGVNTSSFERTSEGDRSPGGAPI